MTGAAFETACASEPQLVPDYDPVFGKKRVYLVCQRCEWQEVLPDGATAFDALRADTRHNSRQRVIQ